MYIVYRGSVSFVLTARAEGELLENDQVLIMMRLSLCMIWLCVFQHVTIANPLNPLHIRIPQSSREEKEEKRGNGVIENWLYSYFVDNERDDKEEEEERLLCENVK